MNGLFLAIFFLICSCVVAPPPGQSIKFRQVKKGQANRIDRVWKATKAKCEKQECGMMVPEEAYNCVNRCVSPSCYAEVYADNPLEDGEIDQTRSRLFVSCVRQEVRGNSYKVAED